ncbi:TRAP transporter small permease [Cryobacterium sp. PH29-G1]|uniref:TRAP transporter small permease n=1 Tax=Cryobacterium sp. PH29-G1 TaxID=3046211 RepID=UPI0024BA1AB4|nr:TRAP transporter small permease [Cryobacterium sp. PH29-G1]MDJ0347937.1 TRAP transporter small permease [Cryobacterium sp. PH29-G1]
MKQDHENDGPSQRAAGFIGEAFDMNTTSIKIPGRGLLNRLAAIMEGLSGIVVLALAIVVTLGVIARSLSIPLVGAIEVAGVSLVVMTLLVAPALIFRNEHVKIELTNGLGGQRTQRVIDVIALLVQILVAAVLLYATFLLFAQDLQRGTAFLGELRLPRAMLTAVLPLSFGMMLVFLVPQLVRALRPRRTSAPSTPEEN